MKKWTTVWGTSSAPAPRNECNYGKDITFRYAIPMLCDGDKIRITLSNLYSDEECVINSVTVGRAEKVGDRKTTDIISLPFNGRKSGKIDAFSSITSDPIPYKVKKGEILNVSFYIKDITKMATATPLTGKYSYGFICGGDQTEKEDFALYREHTASRHYFLSQVDVECENASGWTFFGDSITSFYWTDEAKSLLLSETDGNQISIVRKAIAGGEVWTDYSNWAIRHYGESGVKRFEREINEAHNCDNVLVFHGINDIIHPNGTTYRPLSLLPTVEKMIDGFKFYAKTAHKNGKKIYFTTILPFKGWRSYDEQRNEIRKNLNEWIRTTDLIDGFVDFDKVLQDETDPDKIPAHLTEDNLHPSLEGAKLLAKAFYDKFIKN